jgi:hypothetical protein
MAVSYSHVSILIILKTRPNQASKFSECDACMYVVFFWVFLGCVLTNRIIGNIYVRPVYHRTNVFFCYFWLLTVTCYFFSPCIAKYCIYHSCWSKNVLQNIVFTTHIGLSVLQGHGDFLPNDKEYTSLVRLFPNCLRRKTSKEVNLNWLDCFAF